MKLDGIRNKVFLDRYALKDKTGNPLEKTPDEMWRRVAKGIAGVEKKRRRQEWEDKFYEVMRDFKFLPGGRILAGAGTGFDVTYYNCFVIPNPPDSRGGIMENLTQMIEIMAAGGGVGLNLSSLRPRGARVRKVNGFSSGPINWAELYSLATKDIIQQGGTRRGALMLMLHDWHPDIEEFITVKQDLSKINGANLSVCVSDEFMEAVKKDADWELMFPDIDDPKYDTEWDGNIHAWRKNGGAVKVHKTVKASVIWNLICEAAWRSAEPGLHFLDRSNKRSNTWYFENLVATNPCGEQPLGPWAVCNLGAMNLSAYVADGAFDYESFGQDVQVAMRFLDNVIDDTHYFIKENETIAKDIRRTGLGIMGIADAFIKMKVRYGSPESIEIAREIFKTLRDNAYIASSEIAKEKGSFPKYDQKKYLQGYHIKDLPRSIRASIKEHGIRNAVLLTIAPTGTTSLVAGVSSGVEPVYEFEFLRKTKVGDAKMYHPLFEAWKNEHPEDPKPDYFASANDLTPEDHVKVQAVAQEYIDSSISKTVNAPNAHTIEDVKRLYMLSYDMGLKGITYMRDGSRPGVLSRQDDKKQEKEAHTEKMQQIAPNTIKPRALVMHGSTYKVATPVGTAYITVNTNGHNEPFELFINVGKAGSDISAMAEALGRMVSLNLRTSPHVDAEKRIREVIHHFSGIGGSRSVGFGKEKVRSLPDAVSKVLTAHVEMVQQQKHVAAYGYTKPTNGTPQTNGNGTANGHAEGAHAETDEVVQEITEAAVQTAAPLHAEARESYDICPDCGVMALAYEEGCKKCYSCGYSEC